MRRRYWIAFLCVLLSQAGVAQVKQFFASTNYHPANLRTIVKNEEVAGYYSCYRYQTVSPEQYEYKVEVMDYALRQTNEFTILPRQYEKLINVASNGSTFCFQFSSYMNLGVHVMLTDFEGKILLDELRGNDVELSADNALAGELYPVATGFMYKRVNRDKTVEYVFIDNEGKMKWTIGDRADAISENSKWKRTHVKFMDEHIMALSFEKEADTIRLYSMMNGQWLFDIPYEQNGLRLYPNVMYMKGNNIHVLGQFLPATDKSIKSGVLKPTGIFRVIYESSGHVVDSTFMPWREAWRDTSTPLMVYDKKNSKYVWIHQFVQKYNTIHALGEVFDSALDPDFGKLSAVGMREYVMLTLDSAFAVDSLHTLIARGSGHGTKHMAYPHIPERSLSAARTGDVDFRFVQSDARSPAFHGVFYVEKKEEKGAGRISGIEAVGVSRDGTWRRAVLPLEKKPASVMVLPSKAGYIVYYEVYVVDQYIYYALDMKRFDF